MTHPGWYPDPDDPARAPGGRIESLSGASPGLYGGTGEEPVCDPAALAGFLEHNPQKADAFAEALGIGAGVEDGQGNVLRFVFNAERRVSGILTGRDPEVFAPEGCA